MNKGREISENETYLYMQTSSKVIQQEKVSKPLQTVSGYVQFVYRCPVAAPGNGGKVQNV